TRTGDEVMRREMRQFEGSWYSQAAIDRSKIRLQRLGIFETVEVDKTPVAGSNDQVDVTYMVKEASSGEFQVGLGYSQDDGATLTFQISQRNFLGTGRSLSMKAVRNSSDEQYAFSVAEPYFSDTGIGLNYGASWARTYQDSDDDSSYDSEQGTLNLTTILPLSEDNTFSLGVSLETRTLYLTEGYYPPSYLDFQNKLGSNQVDTWSLRTSWSSDSRDSYLTPTRGTYQRIGAEIALPGSDVTYYRLDYDFSRYWRMGPLLMLTRAELGYGDTYGDGDEIGYPFFKRYYAGGVRSIRVFTDNSLGPCEYVTAYDECRPSGGTVKTLGGLEFSIPGLLGKAGNSGTQLALFVDAGNVFADTSSVDANEFRVSAGLSLLWRSPMGPIAISYGLPLRSEEDDEIERLQFTFGSQF
ncbi:outer membrane protein assembly factor BamA, partial [Lysobacter sp. Root559]